MDKSEVLVLGRGFLGKQFVKNGYKVVGRDDFNFSHDMNYADLESFSILDGYSVIINTIGISGTRYCEDSSNWDEVFKVNSELPHLLSAYCKKNDKKLVHVSSGCVYDSNATPQKEDGFVSSHCRYVVSKLVGEYGCDITRDLILRPRLYFGETSDKNNLLNKIPTFRGFLEEDNSYTSVQTIVEATTALLENNCVGVYNVANTGSGSILDIGMQLNISGKGCEYETISPDLLRRNQGIHLVNNIMCTSKLEEVYTPPSLDCELERCWSELND